MEIGLMRATVISAAILALALAMAGAGAAQAQEAMSTAGASGTPPPEETARQIDRWLAESPQASAQDDGLLADLTGLRERKVHGEVGVAVGTGGYRSAYLTTVMPLGETGTLALSFSQTQNAPGYWRDGHIYRRGPGGYAPMW